MTASISIASASDTMDEAKLLKRRLKGNSQKIRRWLNIPELLPKLRERGLVDTEEREKLLTLHRDRKRRELFGVLYKALRKKGSDAIVEFHGCLQDEQQHLGHKYAAELLKGGLSDEEDMRKSELVQDAIRKSESTIQESLDLVQLLPHLHKSKLVTRSEYDTLRGEQTIMGRTERIQELLAILDTKGPHSSLLFLRCLEEEKSHSGHVQLHQDILSILQEEEEKPMLRSAAMCFKHCIIPKKGWLGRLGLEGQLAKKKYLAEMQKLQKCRYMGKWEDFRSGIDKLTRSENLDVRTMGKLHQAVASIMEGKTEHSLKLIVEAERDCNLLHGNNRVIMSGRCLYIRSAVHRHHQDYAKAEEYLLAAKKVLANALPGEDTASLHYHMGTLALDSIQRNLVSDSQSIGGAKEEAESHFAMAIEHAEREDSGLPLIGWHSRIFLILLCLGSSHHQIGQIPPMSQDMEKAEGILNGINPDDLPWRTLALYHVASSDICRWKGDLSTAERQATYGLGVAEAHSFAFEKKFAMNRLQDLHELQ